MSSADVARSRRNALVLTGTAVTLGLLMLYPTSTNSTGSHRRPGTPLAKAGVVAAAPVTSGAPVASITVNGTSVDTRYGPVQVQLVVKGKRIVKATAIDFPQSGGRDREINGQAVPVLQSETMRAQGATIDTVSGATFTSDGYRTSLQSALDAAHLR
jgi:uncharacterized protein with FMN-binding domain